MLKLPAFGGALAPRAPLLDDETHLFIDPVFEGEALALDVVDKRSRAVVILGEGESVADLGFHLLAVELNELMAGPAVLLRGAR